MFRVLEQLIDPQFLTMMFAAIAAGATVLTLAMPLLARDMLSHAHEGGGVRAREDQAARARAAWRREARSRCGSRRKRT